MATYEILTVDQIRARVLRDQEVRLWDLATAPRPVLRVEDVAGGDVQLWVPGAMGSREFPMTVSADASVRVALDQ